MAITYETSLQYFANGKHLKAATWAQAEEAAGTSAICAARRILSRALGRALDDDEDAYAEGDTTRDEYAVYEQALWMIENGVVANGQGSAALAQMAGAQDAGSRVATNNQASLYAPEALRWLGWTGAAVVNG